MTCGLHFQGHAFRATVEFDLLVLCNTVISFVVFRFGVKDIFGLVSVVLSRYVAGKGSRLTGLRMSIGTVKLKLKAGQEGKEDLK
jgi:hypothetical protein